MFFEGPEKKVELVVRPDFPSLRSFGRPRWSAVVEKSQSQILSEIHNDYCDAYLLSESSLFVYDDWLVMITCGRTTLVQAVLEMLTFVPDEAILSLIYERKNEHFPHLQRTSFFDDANALHAQLPGKAFRFGSQDEHHICLFHTSRPYRPNANDRTMEILMHGVGERARDIFCAGTRHTLEYIRDKTGIRNIYPGFRVDDYVFQPQGYSLNAIRDWEYYTVHVTPEEAGSYVSFETNHPLDDDAMNETLDRLLSIFTPRSFDLIQFQYDRKPRVLGALGYASRSEVAQALDCGYRVCFQHYSRQDLQERAFELELSSGDALPAAPGLPSGPGGAR
ncbi:MAG: adenosylmethionine decarboxylase [Elusimicrobia bacterium]|nr:adenosylmethionine decarboxylase [Elusimicrobiota bacterium]